MKAVEFQLGEWWWQVREREREQEKEKGFRPMWLSLGFESGRLKPHRVTDPEPNFRRGVGGRPTAKQQKGLSSLACFADQSRLNTGFGTARFHSHVRRLDLSISESQCQSHTAREYVRCRGDGQAKQ